MQLVTWSSDHQIRLYPIQCSLTGTTIEHLSRVPSNNTSSTRPVGQGSGVPEFGGPVRTIRMVSPRLRSPSVSTTKQSWDNSAVSPTAAIAITAASAVSTAIASPSEPRPHSIRRLQSSTVPSTKCKVLSICVFLHTFHKPSGFCRCLLSRLGFRLLRRACQFRWGLEEVRNNRIATIVALGAIKTSVILNRE